MSIKHSFVEWNARFKIGIPLIDDQHKKLIDLTKDLYSACLLDTETANKQFIQAARETVDYVRFHLTIEEKMMLLLEYEGYPAHREEHRKFIKEVLDQSQKFNTKSRNIPHKFVYFLRDWILSHIAVCDKEMAAFFLQSDHYKKLEVMFPNNWEYDPLKIHKYDYEKT